MSKFDVDNMAIHPTELNYHNFCVNFRKMNSFKLLGHGYFARVYGDLSNQSVYKIGIVYKSVFEDPYLQFVSKVQANNPLFPRVKNLTLYTHPEKDFYVVQMEKLQNLDSKNVRNLNEKSKSIRTDLLTLFDKRDSNKIDSMWDRRIAKFEEHKNERDFLIAMKRMLYAFNNDMHENNMMMRPNGQLVITDPLCPADFQSISRVRFPK